MTKVLLARNSIFLNIYITNIELKGERRSVLGEGGGEVDPEISEIFTRKVSADPHRAFLVLPEFIYCLFSANSVEPNFLTILW